MARLIATTKKLLMSVEWIVTVLCLFLAGGCEKKNPLDLDYNTFDQRPGRGWRQVAEKGNFLDAAMLIDEYVEKYKDLGESQRVNLNFHAGQMYAFADDYQKAIDRFKRSTYAEEPPDLPLRWNAYVQATIAFLNRDMARLKEYREEILGGPTFDGEKANLEVVDRLIKHFEEPYSRAYWAR